MFITMTCSCGADLELDMGDNELLMMSWAQRFSDSHAKCGYMSPVIADAPEETHTVIVENPKRAE